ncbi:MAG: hypothetical protein JWP95_2306 [Actinotalea sp.]|nr:hypothetical protein [Actinotalea sp.]
MAVISRFPQVEWRGTAGGRLGSSSELDDRSGRPGAVVRDTPPDVLVIRPDALVSDRDRAGWAEGCGLVVAGNGMWAPDVRELVGELGIRDLPRSVGRAALVHDRAGMASVTDQDLLARVVDPEGDVGSHLEVDGPAGAFLRTSDGAVVGALVEPGDGRGRVVVLTVDVSDGPAGSELRRNVVAWAAASAPAPQPAADTWPSMLADPVRHPAWPALKAAVTALQALQATDGSVPEAGDHPAARGHVARITETVRALAHLFPHDEAYLAAVVADLQRWVDEGLGVPDFLDSLVAFQPQTQRVDGLQHLVVFPMYTQNGSRDRRVEAVLVEVVWPDFVAELEAGDYSNRLFVPIRFVDFTAGYDTNSAVLFPETVAMREVPTFTWGAIFADREAARFRTVVRAAAATTGLSLPPDAARLVADQGLAEEVFVMWDLIHDRTHMRGDLPFDTFMIKQRMPYFLYSLEELRCDLPAYRESVALEAEGVEHARLVQYAVLFDRIFRFAITGPRVRNYDGLGGQLLFAWLHQHHVLHWTDNRLTIDWEQVPDVVLALGREIEDLYWRSIDRPKISHWLAAYELVSRTLTPHPGSVWAKGPSALPIDGPLKEMTDAVLPDEFPLSMFYEALTRRIGDVVTSTSGITGRTSTHSVDGAAG